MIFRSDSGYVLHDRASEYCAAGTGWLSLKSFAGGRALYNAGAGTFAVEPASYLILNHGTPYTVTIESIAAVEACCIFWTPAAVTGAYHALNTPDHALLDDPTPRDRAPAFVERTFAAMDELGRCAGRLRVAAGTTSPEPAWLEEQLQYTLDVLLRTQETVQREIAALPQSRAATENGQARAGRAGYTAAKELPHERHKLSARPHRTDRPACQRCRPRNAVLS